MHLGVLHAIFLRNDGPNAALAKRYALWPATFSTEDFIASAGKVDPISAYPLQLAAVSLQRLGWYAKSIEVFREVVAQEPDYYEAWFEMGASYALGAQEKRQQGLTGQAYEDFRQAKTCFQQCLKIKPDYEYAKKNLLQVNRDLLAGR
jgi:tetratricopeptide (TPR) repeat protein